MQNTSEAKSHIVVIFGASGDLTKRKLIPAIYQLYKQKLLPKNFAVVGVGRSKLNHSTFKERLLPFLPMQEEKELCENFLKLLYYKSIDTNNTQDYVELKKYLDELCSLKEIKSNYIFYLSTPPSLYTVIPDNLEKVQLTNEQEGFRRIIIEKPFGIDLESALSLNEFLLTKVKESQIYRIDHYLGKETVQNLLVLRFSNAIFEPIWNRNYIDRVEITSAESLGVEDRGGYYDHSGALRDMVQNHLLQLVGMVAMEPPVLVEADAIRNETLKVFHALRPLTDDDIHNNVIRGQYTSSHINGEQIKGYREEEGVDNESKTETFAAIKFFIDNWRWSNVPFYIRTGKKLPTRVTEIVIHFKPSPHHLFSKKSELPQISNQLIIRIQPDEGILMKMGMKEPGSGFTTRPINLDFHYDELCNTTLPSAYERLLLDCMIGDATLYIRGDAVMEAWKFVKPIQDAWKNDKNTPIYGYPAGTWGPIESDQLIENKDQTWRYPCKNLASDGVYCEL